jgi:hypothetical protein
MPSIYLRDVKVNIPKKAYAHMLVIALFVIAPNCHSLNVC